MCNETEICQQDVFWATKDIGGCHQYLDERLQQVLCPRLRRAKNRFLTSALTGQIRISEAILGKEHSIHENRNLNGISYCKDKKKSDSAQRVAQRIAENNQPTAGC